MAEAVEEVGTTQIIETMSQNLVRFGVNIALSAVFQTDSCINFSVSDFFNSLSHNRKSRLVKRQKLGQSPVTKITSAEHRP